jgi:hypothetical protein
VWWSELLSELADPAWAANTLAAFVGAALAFGGALLLVRIQLRSDHRLAREQIDAMAADRRAERRSDAATELGLELIECSVALDDYTATEYVDRVRESEYDDDAPGADGLYKAMQRAESVLDLDDTPWALWRDLGIAWEASRATVRARRSKSVEDGDLFLACADEMSAVHEGMARFGRALVRWDGVGAIPSREVFTGQWQPVVIDNTIEGSRRDVHIARRRERMETALAAHVAVTAASKRRKPRSKPVGEG